MAAVSQASLRGSDSAPSRGPPTALCSQGDAMALLEQLIDARPTQAGASTRGSSDDWMVWQPEASAVSGILAQVLQSFPGKKYAGRDAVLQCLRTGS